MIYVLENRPRVYDDISEAVDYFFSISPNLAMQFLDRIEEAKTTILNTPLGFEIKHAQIRTILLKQFDFHLYYNWLYNCYYCHFTCP